MVQDVNVTCFQCHMLVSYPAPPHTCEKEGLVFWTTFLVTWGGVAPLSESLNQILERIIICAWHKWSYFEPNRRWNKTNLTVCSELSQETLRPYQVFVNHTMLQSKSSENLSPGCLNVIMTFFMPWAPPHVTRNVAQHTRSSFCFSGEGLGTRLVTCCDVQWCCDHSISAGSGAFKIFHPMIFQKAMDMFYLFPDKGSLLC